MSSTYSHADCSSHSLEAGFGDGFQDGRDPADYHIPDQPLASRLHSGEGVDRLANYSVC
jgi:hypothetical protein